MICRQNPLVPSLSLCQPSALPSSFPPTMSPSASLTPVTASPSLDMSLLPGERHVDSKLALIVEHRVAIIHNPALLINAEECVNQIYILFFFPSFVLAFIACRGGYSMTELVNVPVLFYCLHFVLTFITLTYRWLLHYTAGAYSSFNFISLVRISIHHVPRWWLSELVHVPVLVLFFSPCYMHLTTSRGCCMRELAHEFRLLLFLLIV